MPSNSNNEQFINKLKQQNNYLRQHINDLNEYINHLNVYEYHIQSVNIEKIKGTFQLGHLLEKEQTERDGIHRFFIGEIKIREIEDTGIVGLGVTEKDREQNIILPEEASEQIKKIYEEIKSFLEIDEVPLFFQTLSLKENVLKIIWNKIKDQWSTSYDFFVFYESILKVLNDTISREENSSNTPFDNEIQLEIANSIEEQTKTLFIISCLIDLYLPGYLEKIQVKDIQLVPIQKVSVQHIINVIKDMFQLKKLPLTFDYLCDEINVLRFFFFKVINPVVENVCVQQYFLTVIDLIKNAVIVKKEDTVNNLSVEEQVFLISTLIEHLDLHQKHILIEYLLLNV